MIWKDLNGDGTVNADDRTVIGNPNIRNNYGFSLGLQYKGFDFKTLFQGVLGREIETGVFGSDGLRGYGNVTQRFLDSWTPENPNTDVPRVATSYNYNFTVFVGPLISSSVLNASYLRWRSVELGYNFSQTALHKIHIQNLRIYAAGQNLLTFTKFAKGFDPEQPTTFNNVSDFYPNARTVSIGLNVTF